MDGWMDASVPLASYYSGTVRATTTKFIGVIGTVHRIIGIIELSNYREGAFICCIKISSACNKRGAVSMRSTAPLVTWEGRCCQRCACTDNKTLKNLARKN